MTRRTALGLGGAALAAAASSSIVGSTPAGATHPPSVRSSAARFSAAAVDRLTPSIRPRSDWGADLPPTGPILPEEDVRFLLVHHTASTNDYGEDEVVDQIRRFYEFHTGPEKQWPDVAYNFFVDRFGGIWEARAGSLAGPVRGDATGGSQGFALLCSLIGNHAEAPVSAEAEASMISLLAWLAERHGVDTTPGVTVDFVSRGSNLHPAGAPVTARTVSAHREMSNTSCPGDFAFGLLDQRIPSEVVRLRTEAGGGVVAAPEGSTTIDPQPGTSTETTTATAATEPSTATTATTAAGDEAAAGVTATEPDGGNGGLRGALTAVVAAGVAALAAVAVRAGARLQR